MKNEKKFTGSLKSIKFINKNKNIKGSGNKMNRAETLINNNVDLIQKAIKGYSESEQHIFLEAAKRCIAKGKTNINDVISISNKVVEKMKEAKDER